MRRCSKRDSSNFLPTAISRCVILPPITNPPSSKLPVSHLKNPTCENVTSRFSNDIGFFIEKASSLSKNAKYNLLCYVWNPSENYKFPLDEYKRKFQHSWLAKFPWLVYSEVCNVFCINCFLFGGESTHNSSKLRYLFTAPLKNGHQHCKNWMSIQKNWASLLQLLYMRVSFSYLNNEKQTQSTLYLIKRKKIKSIEIKDALAQSLISSFNVVVKTSP